MLLPHKRSDNKPDLISIGPMMRFMKSFAIFSLALMIFGCASRPLKSREDAGFMLNYLDADPNTANKFIAQTEYKKHIDPSADYKIVIGMDSKLTSLILKEPGSFRNEFQIDRVPIVYENFLNVRRAKLG